MPNPPFAVLRSALASVVVSVSAIIPFASAHAEAIVGLTANNNLITFDSATPGTAALVNVSGLNGGDQLIGIDLRPTTGALYGLAGSGSLYTLNTSTGAATFLGAVTGALNGPGFGFDFNPVPDLAGLASLRIITADANYRVNVNGAPFTNVDTPVNGATATLSGVAYANNDIDPATGTTLYGLGGGSLYRFTNANAGTTVLVGSTGVSALGGATGFDISSTGASFASFATSQAATASGFYAVNLMTGAATLIGAFNSNDGGVIDIAALTPPVPEPETYALMLVGLAGVAFMARRRRT